MSDKSNTWRPTSESELRALLTDELSVCLPEDRSFFESIKVVPTKLPWERRSGAIDEVFVVAQIGKKVLFYDDTEDAFEMAIPDSDGVIRFSGVGQFELRHALAQFRIGGR